MIRMMWQSSVTLIRLTSETGGDATQARPAATTPFSGLVSSASDWLSADGWRNAGAVRLSLRGANPAEVLALRLGLVPEAAAEAWGGMALSGVLISAVRCGLTARLARQPSTPADLAAELG